MIWKHEDEDLAAEQQKKKKRKLEASKYLGSS